MDKIHNDVLQMEKVNTKDQILDVALDLFSIRGYEATSISQIADAVGLRKASLYSHFASKQDILDTLVDELTDEYAQHSILLIFVCLLTTFAVIQEGHVIRTRNCMNENG